jgi:hypothetical protein
LRELPALRLTLEGHECRVNRRNWAVYGRTRRGAQCIP